MRWEVTVTNVEGSRLRVRTGPGLSYRVVDYKYQGDTGIVVDTRVVNNQTWYKWEGTEYWSAMSSITGTEYLHKDADLEEDQKPEQPDPEEAPEPEKEPEYYDITFPKPTPNLNGGKDVNNNMRGGIDTTTSWYQPMEFDNAKSYNVVSDNVIAKNIAALKHNMDIGYSTKDDIYEGYQTGMGKGYVSSLQKKLYNSFNRNKTAFPDKDLSKTFAYVFFTRPDLNILDKGTGATLNPVRQVADDAKYAFIWQNNPWSLKSLVLSGNSQHKFMVMLSNEALSFEVGDVVIKTFEHGETYNGNKIIYGKSDQESNAASEFSIRYIDTVNLDIYKLHLIWVDYINKVSRGIFEPRREYMVNRILDYPASCFYILCGPDGSTILYWQKLTGVFPVNTGENAFSWDSGTLLAKPEINIKYMYSFKSTMDPHILYEFNTLTDTSTKMKRVLDDYNIQTGSTLTHAPRILETTDVVGNKIFRLIWVEN